MHYTTVRRKAETDIRRGRHVNWSRRVDGPSRDPVSSMIGPRHRKPKHL